MRASMLAVIAVATVVGLGVVFAVKSMGLLNPPPAPVVQAPPPPVVEPPAPPPAPVVLVPSRQLFAGDTISPLDVKLRAIRPDEMKEYEARKAEYLPAVPEIVYYRFPAKDIQADQPLKRDDLQAMKKPESLSARLAPGTRAVSVGIQKEHSVGGLIQVGDWVDVYLITDVSRTDASGRIPHTGVLVRQARVVAKRDTLYSIYAPLPPGEPVQFTLATNPYRAALLEYARTIGVLALVPVSASEKDRLESLREEAMRDMSKDLSITFAAPGSTEFKDETERIDRYNRGSLAIGNDELAKVLNLKAIEPPLPPPTSAPPPPAPIPEPPVAVEVYNGVNKAGVVTFPVPQKPIEVTPPPPVPYVPPPPAQYLFQSPSGKETGVTRPSK